MTYTWDGIGFNQFVASQILEDTNGNYYYYDQNYIGFFPITISDGQLVNPDSIPINSEALPQDTVLNDVPDSSDLSTQAATAVLNNKMNAFVAQSSNILNGYNQNPSAYVNTTITAGLGTPAASGGIVNVLNTYAPFLTSPTTNFAFQDILTSWPGGTAVIQGLAGALSNFQNSLNQTLGGPQLVVDFKTKLLRQQMLTADSVNSNQTQISQYLNQGTFTSLASAFPEQMGPLPGLLQTHLNFLNINLAGSIPTADLPPALQGVISSVLGSLFGGSQPQIVNPMDKIVNDINGLNTNGGSSFLAVFGGNLSSLQSTQSYTNQAVNLLSNIVAQIPISSQMAVPNQVTDVNQISAVLLTNAQSTIFNVGGNSSLTASQQSVANLLTVVTNTTSPPISSIPTSFTQILPSVSGLLSQADPSVTQPNLNLSPDPTVQTQQSVTSAQQTAANLAAIFRTLPPGSSFNNLDEVPLRPRNIPLNGTQGDYQIIPSYNF
jgi:hypothetical protein